MLRQSHARRSVWNWAELVVELVVKLLSTARCSLLAPADRRRPRCTTHSALPQSAPAAPFFLLQAVAAATGHSCTLARFHAGCCFAARDTSNSSSFTPTTSPLPTHPSTVDAASTPPSALSVVLVLSGILWLPVRSLPSPPLHCKSCTLPHHLLRGSR